MGCYVGCYVSCYVSCYVVVVVVMYGGAIVARMYIHRDLHV